jgi:hypothetical protein
VQRSTDEHETLLFVAADKIITSSKTLFEKLDELAGINSTIAIRLALKRGATTPEDFAKVFEEQGVNPDLARSAGNVAAIHLEQRGAEKTAAQRAGNATSKSVFPLSRRLIEWLLLASLAVSLLVAPWRSSYSRSRHDTLGYSVLFIAPKESAEIDLTRYAVQVFAVSAICAVAYLKIRQEPASR